ncbi:unnamed protein product [Ambrosiozyma monospora]|uniref:Unnamed protein product n=1 Tax=Ambrosiozyma monospora TaxID=43982 RepID=A0ACB5T4Z0_AMBMO|nr:unnamed protein product [Ambrosiozyma monospora]
MILGLAQAFSGIIHDHKGSRPYLVKIQAIRGISCIIELSNSFLACLSQIMTCLQIALDSEELQFECLECLKVIVLSTDYLHLSTILDLLISYLIQKYDTFSDKCKSLAKHVLILIMNKDPKVAREHPSYIYSLNTNKNFSDIVAYEVKPRAILLEFSRRLTSDNKWVVLQVLADCQLFFKTREMDVQKHWLKDPRLVAHFSIFLSNLLAASNKFSVNNVDISTECSKLLAMLGALDMSKFDSYFKKHSEKRIILLSNLTDDNETAEFSVYFIDNILAKSFIASTDPRKQLFLAYSMQEYVRMLGLTPKKIEDQDSSEFKLWKKFNKLSQTVLKPLLSSKYSKNFNDAKLLHYPIFSNSKKYSIWIREFTSDLLVRASKLAKLPKTAKGIFTNVSIIIKDQDISIAEFLLPYVALMLLIYGNKETFSNIETEMNTILNQDLDELSNDSMVESLKACCQFAY